MTRLLLTSIPHFREGALSFAAFGTAHRMVYSHSGLVQLRTLRSVRCRFSFEKVSHTPAGNTNNEIQSAGEISNQGTIYTVKVTDREDLDREIVKSEHGTITIPEYELTIPPGKGQMTTIEGLISDVIADLALDQPVRMHTDAATHDKIEALLNKLRRLVDAEQDLPAFTVSVDDPSGNSFAQPSILGLSDPKWRKRQYNRTKEQNIQIGLLAPEAADPPPPRVATLTDDMDGEMPAEVFSFPSTCSSCGSTLETLMKKVIIPHFKVRRALLYVLTFEGSDHSHRTSG